MKRYKIKLSQSEVKKLKAIINKGSHSSRAFRAAYILLNCDEGEYSDKVSNKEISKILKVSMRTIDRVKKRFIEEGFEAVLSARPRSRIYEVKLDGEVEAKLIKLCCSKPPAGFAKWSLRLLADKMVALEYVDSISHVSVRNILKKTSLSLGKLEVG